MIQITFRQPLCMQCCQLTEWKLQDFSVTQILREINFGESGSSKTSVFAILGALNSVDLVNFSLEKNAKSH